MYCLPDSPQNRQVVTTIVHRTISDPRGYLVSTLPALAASSATVVPVTPNPFRCSGLAPGRYIVFTQIYNDVQPPLSKTASIENYISIAVVTAHDGQVVEALGFRRANGTAGDFRQSLQ